MVLAQPVQVHYQMIALNVISDSVQLKTKLVKQFIVHKNNIECKQVAKSAVQFCVKIVLDQIMINALLAVIQWMLLQLPIYNIILLACLIVPQECIKKVLVTDASIVNLRLILAKMMIIILNVKKIIFYKKLMKNLFACKNVLH